MLHGQIENVGSDDQVQGAIQTVLAHPTDPDILYIGAVNGGIWLTTDAMSPEPTWIPLTDHLPTLSIGLRTTVARTTSVFDSESDEFLSVEESQLLSRYGNGLDGSDGFLDGNSNWIVNGELDSDGAGQNVASDVAAIDDASAEDDDGLPEEWVASGGKLGRALIDWNSGALTS